MNEYASQLSQLPRPPAAIHFVGIGGIGMSGLARMLAHRGYRITGSDVVESPAVDALRDEGFPVMVGHAPEHVRGADFVVVTAAAKETNPEVQAARVAGVPVVKRAAVLGLLCNERDCIAVAGTHGKSTTSGMLALALDRAGADPSFAVGAVVTQLGTNARAGEGRLFIAEADEYDYSFLWLRPAVAIVTNIEHDHPDLFPTPDAIEDAFAHFVQGIRPDGALVMSADDPGCRRLLSRLEPVRSRVITFGTAPAAHWRLDQGHGVDRVISPAGATLSLRLQVPGHHNRLNALAALAAADVVGIDPGSLLPGLEGFAGVGRRFDVRGVERGVTVIDDYAHHPTEIRATIAAARERYADARVWAVFQPHTYSRTKELLDDFAAALDTADRVVLAAIYPARETDDLGVRALDIAARMSVRHVDLVDTAAQAGELTAEAAAPGDVVLVLGAGDIWTASGVLLRALRDQVGKQ